MKREGGWEGGGRIGGRGQRPREWGKPKYRRDSRRRRRRRSPDVCINGGNACYLLSSPPLPPSFLTPSSHSLAPLAILLSFSLFFSLVSSISFRFTYTSSPPAAAILSERHGHFHRRVSIFSLDGLPAARCRYSLLHFLDT